MANSGPPRPLQQLEGLFGFPYAYLNSTELIFLDWSNLKNFTLRREFLVNLKIQSRGLKMMAQQINHEVHCDIRSKPNALRGRKIFNVII